mgnify:CR=1 FL=1
MTPDPVAPSLKQQQYILELEARLASGAKYISELEARLSSRKYAIFKPMPKTHDFAGLRFEETGEYRQAKPGEFFCYTDFEPVRLQPPVGSTDAKYRILRPVAILPRVQE